MLMLKLTEIGTHLFHILVLIGCGHLLQIGKMFEAIQLATTGGLCVIILAGAGVLAEFIKSKGG